MIAIDRSEYAEIVIEDGLDEAARRDADEIHFLTAVESDDSNELSAARTWLDSATRDPIDTFKCTDRKITLHVRRGRPVTVIARVAAELQPDLLVIGRFGIASIADIVLDLVHVPTLVIGLEGHVLEPQCQDCGKVRQQSDGERLFCDRHSGDYSPDLAMRLPSWTNLGSRLW